MLLLKNLIIATVFSGLFVGWLPLRIFERRARVPEVFEPQHLASLLVAALAAIGFLHCLWVMNTRGRGTPLPLLPPRHLMQRGAYRWVRNPLYLCVIAFVAAEAAFFESLGIAIYAVCLACFFQVFVHLYEEPDLSFRFGAMYEDYKRAVPRWMPRPPRRDPVESARMNRER